jgi:hypothetical protein
VVLYAFETWSLTVREEHKVGVFENMVLKRIFQRKRNGVTGGWRKLHNEELHDLYLSRIPGLHGGDYEEWCLLGCYAVWLLEEQTFRRNLVPP